MNDIAWLLAPPNPGVFSHLNASFSKLHSCTPKLDEMKNSYFLDFSNSDLRAIISAPIFYKSIF
jgi:hypothetical protein